MAVMYLSTAKPELSGGNVAFGVVSVLFRLSGRVSAQNLLAVAGFPVTKDIPTKSGKYFRKDGTLVISFLTKGKVNETIR